LADGLNCRSRVAAFEEQGSRGLYDRGTSQASPCLAARAALRTAGPHVGSHGYETTTLRLRVVLSNRRGTDSPGRTHSGLVSRRSVGLGVTEVLSVTEVMMRRSAAAVVSVAWGVALGGTFACLLPYLLGEWVFHRPLPYWTVAQVAGGLLICAGLVPIIHSFI